MKGTMSLLAAMALLVLTLLVVPVQAGDLNPPGAPAPTMKTLDQITPTWDQVISNPADRFKLVMGGAAVLDKETGLVWEKTPESHYYTGIDALAYVCTGKSVGGRMGWRLPAIEELATLVSLPSGHPFNPYSDAMFWSTTPNYSDTTKAWVFEWKYNLIQRGIDRTGSGMVWCVRGGRP